MEELVRLHQPRSVGYPLPHPHPSPFPEGPFQCQSCVPSLAQDLPSTRRTVVPRAPCKARGLRENSARTRERVPARHHHHLHWSCQHIDAAFSSRSTNQVPQLRAELLGGRSEIL
jgi:hypothetical protein